MSYGVSVALQAAVYQHLLADSALAGLIGSAIYDEVPNGTIPSTYVTLGPEVVLDRSDGDGSGALHRIEVSVVSDVSGFAGAKAVAVAVSDALTEADLALARGHLVAMRFERAVASREEAANLRRIDLRFAARVQDN
ncbi:DUF3168 domain-containing protein [Cognatishimia maritima]|uniref:DUF3168 domain-containing protein n=1 Tax=Cognatishimia maritima TaxID=870908 RepID=A0A1M5JI08_9RHOB|nr:DUF3168 domain-containing protein [Cognatishimia maritima]SHG40177.1 Protein of unknown function [Cognatishimia maritima]